MDSAFRLLVPLDGSPIAREGVRVAGALTAPDRVWTLRVLRPDGGLGPIDPLDVEARRAAALHELRVELSENHLGGVAQVAVGRPAERIAGFARDYKMDGVVMSSHGRTGLGRLLMGSVAERVLRLAACPVLVFHSVAAAERLRQARPRVLLAVDLADGAAELIGQAAPWIERLDAEVVLTNVMPEAVPGEGDHAAEQLRRRGALQELLERLPIERRGGVSVLVGHPRDALAAAAERHDLVIVGAHARSGVERLLLGSVTEGLARLAPASLVLPVYTSV